MRTEDDGKSDALVALTASIVAAYVQNHVVPSREIAALISSIHTALENVGSDTVLSPVLPAEEQKPAVSIRKSVTDEYIISLEDGRKFKSLKRHLAASYNMTPEEYRTKWKLPDDYPMVAPAYAEKRAQLARDIGLGQTRRKTE